MEQHPLRVGDAGAIRPDGDAAVEHPRGFTVPCFTSIHDEQIREHLREDRFFWLDLMSPGEEDLRRLEELFAFHPLAIEDTANFGQRPKLDDYRDYMFLVFYGAAEHPTDAEHLLREVHLFVSGHYLVTVHRDPIPALDDQQSRIEQQTLSSEQFVLYRVVDSLTDTFFPLLTDLDDRIDNLEEEVVVCPDEEQLQQLFALKRQLVALRKVITPQRDIFARSIEQLSELPGLELDQRDYFRDVYDHLIRISDLIDSYRDLLSSATDLYLSTVANRQNDVMKQLAIVGTIFLPLSFITGFFGMNFGWLVNHAITHTWTFWALGVGSMVATLIGLLFFFRRKRWI